MMGPATSERKVPKKETADYSDLGRTIKEVVEMASLNRTISELNREYYYLEQECKKLKKKNKKLKKKIKQLKRRK